jgi:hypothetical protein
MADVYHQSSFFVDDPISIPKQCQQQEDVEIMAFFNGSYSLGKA